MGLRLSSVNLYVTALVTTVILFLVQFSKSENYFGNHSDSISILTHLSDNYTAAAAIRLYQGESEDEKFVGNLSNQSTGDSRLLHLVKSKFGCPQTDRFDLTYLGQHLTILSPNYPFSYPKNTDCKYHLNSPPGTKMKLKCDITVPPRLFHKCHQKPGDFFQYSLVGDENASVDNYKLCGRYLLKAFSKANQLLIAIHSQSVNLFTLFHPTKSFKCKVKVIKSKKGGAGGTTAIPNTCGSANVNLGGMRKAAGQSSKILGGSPAASGQFPWRCGLQIVKGGAITRTCTCSIISNEWILTSTHCINMEDPANVFVFVGQTSFSGVMGGMGSGLGVSQVVKNNLFGGGLNDDVGVVKLKQPLAFSSTVRPICLPCPYKGQQFIESKVTVSGFVETSPNTFTLLTQDVKTMNRPQCQKLQPINNDEICIYEPGKTTCVNMGDTGSYADYQDPASGIYYAAGVNSWGDVCGSETKPSIHQNVAKFIDWIEKNTGTKFCV